MGESTADWRDQKYSAKHILEFHGGEEAFWDFAISLIRYARSEVADHWVLPDDAKGEPDNAYLIFKLLQVISVLMESVEDGGREARSQLARFAVAKRLADDPKAKAMEQIREEWLRRMNAGKRFKAVEFAREMARKHHDIVTVETIKNAQTRWLKAAVIVPDK